MSKLIVTVSEGTDPSFVENIMHRAKVKGYDNLSDFFQYLVEKDARCRMDLGYALETVKGTFNTVTEDQLRNCLFEDRQYSFQDIYDTVNKSAGLGLPEFKELSIGARRALPRQFRTTPVGKSTLAFDHCTLPGHFGIWSLIPK